MTKEEYLKRKIEFREDGIYLGDTPLMYMIENGWIQGEAQKVLDEYKPKSILEIGYGYGFTASVFKQCPRHVIIEAHPTIAEIGRKNGYEIIEGFVQDVDLKEHFDVIYDDRAECVWNDDLGWLKKYNYKHYVPWKSPNYRKLMEEKNGDRKSNN